MAKHGMDPQHVHIDVGTDFAVVDGASTTDVLLPVSFKRHGFTSSGRTGCHWTRDTAAMAKFNDDGTVAALERAQATHPSSQRRVPAVRQRRGRFDGNCMCPSGRLPLGS